MKLFHQKVNHYDLRNPYEFSVPNVNSVFHGQRSIMYLDPIIWQLIPSEFKDLNTVSAFKAAIKKNGSQTTAHAGHVKHISKMLDLFKLLVSVNNRCWVECGIFSPGFLVEVFSVSGWLFFLKCFTFIFLIFTFVFKQSVFSHNLD